MPRLHTPLRHPDNPSLHLHYGAYFENLRIQESKGPFIREYLERLLLTMDRALGQHPRVFAFRIDLRFPDGVERPEWTCTNQVMVRFIESLNAKIESNRCRARDRSKCSHDTSVRYVWAREQGRHGKPHYHVAILLNHDAFHTLGSYEEGRDNMFNRLVQAWASALKLSVREVIGLVHVPENAQYRLRRNESKGQDDFFYRSSYLCKAATKPYGDRLHGFGASRA